ncbi:TPA: hypothetical protein IAC10_11955 [Candidatus Scatousia excrementigallinarum]|uniref:Uncharacterized protein n=1 Tax=Candidatus Scatousia excrementigallinarum TaxID=2840935 RepID=A0A9D1F1M0_9BACT|nr:hypothetical protein [Candidatus Scatousia excrementigallinarum]
MTASSDYARLCSLPSGSYYLLISSVKAGGKDKYNVKPENISFTITNSDWEGNASFEKLVKNCKEDGYFEANGKKWSCPFYPTPLTKAECEAQKNNLGISGCYEEPDYWAGAVKQCGGVQNMPTQADIAKIVSSIYKGNPNIEEYKDYNLTYENGTASSLGLPEPPFTLWTGEEYVGLAVYEGFWPTVVRWLTNGRTTQVIQAVCKNGL